MRPPDTAAIETLFRAHRRRLLQLALRMLADLGEAEDVVQEAFGRLTRADLATIDDPEGWLVVVTSRLCLDRLRSRRRRRTDLFGSDPERPDPGAADPADQLALVDRVTLSMHVVLERLSPAERTAFVLHDVFQLPFEEIGDVVGRTPTACRQLASRARRNVRTAAAGRRFPVEDETQREVAERFIAACTAGDLDGLLAVLHPAVDGTGDTTGKIRTGAEPVGRGILGYLGPAAAPTLLHVPIGEQAGIVVLHGHVVAAIVVLTITGGQVVHVEALAGPAPRAAVSAALGVTPA